MSGRTSGFLALFAGLCAAACGPSGHDELPASVAAALGDLTEQCRAGEGTPRPDGAIKRLDLNSDGREDFVLFAGWIVCENAWSIYGDREKFLSVFSGDGKGGATEAFTGSVYDAKIENVGSASQLWLTTSAEDCGRPRAEVFADESFCERALEWNAAAARFDWAPVSTVRRIE
jgi:hypothetical protein